MDNMNRRILYWLAVTGLCAILLLCFAVFGNKPIIDSNGNLVHWKMKSRPF